MPQPLHVTADDFVFTTPTGRPVDEERFVQQHWHRALRATAIRPRKFYATRHTFISASLEAGYKIKRLADYCGMSVEMIERHYAGYLRDETPEEILRLGGQPSEPSNAPHHTPAAPASSIKTGTLPGTFRRARRSSQQAANMIGEMLAEGGDSNFERTKSARNPRTAQLRRLLNGTRRSRSREVIPKRPERTHLDPEKQERFPLAVSWDSSPRATPVA
jgi:hypothetical protein